MDLLAMMMAAALIAVVMPTGLTFTVMMPAFVTFTVMMVMVVAPGIRIIFQSSVSKSFRGSIRRSLNARIKLDPGIRKRHLRTHTNASADQGVRLHSLQEACKSAMTASVGVNNLLADDFTLFNIVQLKLLCMTEVLEDLSIFICDCDSHGMYSFLYDFLINLNRLVFTVSACNQQPFPVHKGICDFFPCAVISGCNGGSGNIHSGSTSLLCETFFIQQSQCLKFVNGHLNAFCGCDVVRREAAIDRELLYSAASEWSWHKLPFLTYVSNYNIPENDICQ